MKFKRSKLLSAYVVVRYLSSTYKGTSKKLKLCYKQLTKEDRQCYGQVLLAKKHQGITPITSGQNSAKYHKKVLTIKEIFERYEQSNGNPIYLEAIKFLLEQIFWLSPNLVED